MAFVCIFAGLSLPLPGLGPCWVRLHAALANQLLPTGLASGAGLRFDTSAELLSLHPWSLVLMVAPAGAGPTLTLPIDLRGLVYLPLACFVALALATPFGSPKSNCILCGVGLLVLEPLLLGLVTLPLISFLGGLGPIRAFELGRISQTLLQIAYRALVASPSMAYVIPLLLWWCMLVSGRFPKSEIGLRNPQTQSPLR